MKNTIKICKICKCTSEEQTFGVNRLQCNLCRQKIYKLNKEYFKDYYVKNKEKILLNQYDLYHNKYKNIL